MVRAAATGVIDFREADPFDSWWQRRLHWILEEIDNQDYRKLLAIQHNHWITLMGNRVNEEGWEKAYEHARSALNLATQYTFPWYKEQLGGPGMSERENAIDEWRKEWGRPGEPKYDEMVANLAKVFASARKRRKMRPRLK